MCDGHVVSSGHHILVDLNGNRIITRGLEFAIQHILMIYQVFQDLINQLLLVATHGKYTFVREKSLTNERREHNWLAP